MESTWFGIAYNTAQEICLRFSATQTEQLLHFYCIQYSIELSDENMLPFSGLLLVLGLFSIVSIQPVKLFIWSNAKNDTIKYCFNL